MRFADPQACPDCRGVITGHSTCPQCGLDLTTPEVRQLWQLLLQADELLETAVRTRDAATVVEPEPEPAHVPEPVPVPEPIGIPTSAPVPPVASDPALAPWTPPAYPAAAAAPKPPRRVSAGAVLLGLGALGMIVAAFIFLTVSWGSLGVAGRALVLLVITGLIGGAAAWATRRPLRGSAEALWTIFLMMATLDWFVACDQGLLGLDTLSATLSAVVWAVVAVAIGALIVHRGRPSLGADLVAPMVVSGVAVVVGSSAIGVELEAQGVNLFWSTAVATAVAGGAALLLLKLHQRISFFIAGAFAALGIVVAVVLAVIDVVQNPSARELTLEGHAFPMIVVIAAIVATGMLIERVTLVASALAGAGLVFLLAAPAEDAAPGRGVIVTVAVAALVAGVLLHGPGAWRQGARALVGLLTVGLSMLAIGWGAEALEVVAEAAEELRTASIDAGPQDVAGPWWLALVLAVALTGVLIAARRWPETTVVKRHLVPSAAVVAAVGIVITVAAAEPTYVVNAAAIMATAMLLAVVLDRFAMPWQVVPPVAVALAMVAGLSHDVASAAIWLVGGVALAAMSTRIADRLTRDAVVLVSAGSVVGVVSFVLDLADASPAGFALAYVLTAAVLSAVALVLRDQRGVPIEVVAGITALVGLMLATDQSESAVRAGLWVLTSVLVLLLSLGAGRVADVWGSVDWSRAYRIAGVVTLLGAVLVSLPDTAVALASSAFAAVVIAGLSWRAVHPGERQALAFLSPLAALGALGSGLDQVNALPQTFSISFVAVAALLAVVAHVVRGGRGLPVEAAAGVALAVGLVWTADVPDVLWRAVTWAVAALLVLAVSLLPRSWPGLERALLLRIGGAAGLVVAMLLPLPDSASSVGFWAGGAIVLAAISWFTPVRHEAEATALVAAVATVGTVVLGLDLAGASSEIQSLALVVTAAVLCAVGALENGLRRIPVEVAAAPTAVLGVAVASDGTDVAWQAVVWTVLGALALLLTLARPGTTGPRQLIYRVTGSVSLGIAYVLRLVASDVGVVEAYTLPFAVLLLGAGWWTMRREPARSSLIALGPALALALLPSLPLALAEPTGLRALILGLGALAVLTVGIRRGWRAPFVAGAVIVTVLVLVNIGPYANAAPRVVVIAVVSAVLLGVGITWEDRVRDGRRLAAYVRSMR